MITSSKLSLENDQTNEIGINPSKFGSGESVEDETQRFVKHSPLVSLLLMTIGPLSNLISAVFSTFEMYMIAKRFNQNSDAIQILGFSHQYQSLITIVGVYFSQCFVTRVSSLIGLGEREEAAHLTSDIFKLTLIISIIAYIPLYFLLKPLLKFVGTSPDVMEKAMEFNSFMLWFVPFSNLFVQATSYFQSIGKVIFMAISLTIYLTVQTFAISPFTLFVCKVSTTQMKVSKVIVDILFSFLLITLIYRGKFSLKPSIRQLLSFKFSKTILKSLLYPMPVLFGFLGSIVPPMLVLWALTSRKLEPGVQSAIGSVYAVFTQLYSITHALPSAIAVGYLTTGNHAYGSNNLIRFKKILFWAMTISVCMGLLFSFIFVVFNRQIASLFIHDQDILAVSGKLLPIPFYTSVQNNFNYIVYSTLLILKKPLLSTIPQLAQITILCVGSVIIKLKYTGDYVKIMHIYNISDITCLIIDIALFIYSVVILSRQIRERNDDSLYSCLDTNSESIQ